MQYTHKDLLSQGGIISALLHPEKKNCKNGSKEIKPALNKKLSSEKII